MDEENEDKGGAEKDDWTCLERLLKFDMNARQMHSLFEQATQYYHCQDTYSISTNCQQCTVRLQIYFRQFFNSYFECLLF